MYNDGTLTTFTFVIILWFMFSMFIVLSFFISSKRKLEWGKSKDAITFHRALKGMIMTIIVVGIGLIAFDRHRLNKAHDLSIPTTTLSETEITYREKELESQKELQNRVKHVDELIEQTNK